MNDTAGEAEADTNGAGKGRRGSNSQVDTASRSAPIPVVVDQSVDGSKNDNIVDVEDVEAVAPGAEEEAVAPVAEEEGEADHTGAGNGRGGSSSDGDSVFETFLNAEGLEEHGRKLAPQKLESMCIVLGVDF